MDGFQELQLDVKKALNDDFQKGSIDIIEMMSALYICGQTRTEEELREAISLFSDNYSALSYLLSKEKGEERADFETDIQDVVSRMLKDDPLRATEVAKFIEGKEITIDQLVAQFPEVEKYLN